MLARISSVTESSRGIARLIGWGIVGIAAILTLTAVLLFLSLPSANAFNARVERIFVEFDTEVGGELA